MIIACITSFIVGAFIGFVSNCKGGKSCNKVHFYVARDKDKTLWLYIGKPIKDEVYSSFVTNESSGVICSRSGFESLGLNIDDYKDLKWEDEPVEVFLNLED